MVYMDEEKKVVKELLLECSKDQNIPYSLTQHIITKEINYAHMQRRRGLKEEIRSLIIKYVNDNKIQVKTMMGE